MRHPPFASRCERRGLDSSPLPDRRGSDRVDTAKDPADSTRALPAMDGAVAQPRLSQLSPRHDAPLSAGEVRDRLTNRCAVGNVRHADISHTARNLAPEAWLRSRNLRLWKDAQPWMS